LFSWRITRAATVQRIPNTIHIHQIPANCFWLPADAALLAFAAISSPFNSEESI
jgi:hypothetical protein